MPFIIRQYLIDRLKEHSLDCAFKDEGDRVIIFIRWKDYFEIEYHGSTETGYSIFDVSFTQTPCYSVLYFYERIIEEILEEYTRLAKYLKLERNN